MRTNNDITQIITAEVIQANAKDWSNVIGKGGGYFLLPISISTYHKRVTELWVRLNNGKETRIDFSGDFPVLPGHRLALLTTPTHIWAARNFNTGNIYWLATIDWLAGTFRRVAHWIILAGFLPAIFGGILIAELQHPQSRGYIGMPPPNALVSLITLVVLAVGIDIIRYYIHRRRVTFWKGIMKEGNNKLLNASLN